MASVALERSAARSAPDEGSLFRLRCWRMGGPGGGEEGEERGAGWRNATKSRRVTSKRIWWDLCARVRRALYMRVRHSYQGVGMRLLEL